MALDNLTLTSTGNFYTSKLTGNMGIPIGKGF